MERRLRVLLTGLSSFTGAWFAHALASAGHAVTGMLQRPAASYSPLVQFRLASARSVGVQFVEGLSYGDGGLLALIDTGFDVIGYHGADIRDYRSPSFDVLRAVEGNARGINELCERAARAGTARLIVTGTVAEPFEGLSDEPERAMSPYGLSKSLTWDLVRFYAHRFGLPVAKFVIPNPFGRYEQERYCTYLVRTWLAGQTAEVRTPSYVRDNIPVDMLARAYADFAARCAVDPLAMRCNPSGYVGTQGDFTVRFAREIGTRLEIRADFALTEQTRFDEPRIRTNISVMVPLWDETAFWDDLALDYAERLRT